MKSQCCFAFRPFRLVQRVHSRQCRLVFLFIVGCTWLSCCQPQATEQSSAAKDDSSPEAAAFTTQLPIEHARGFDLTYHGSYKMLHLLLGRDTIRYLLLPAGKPVPPQANADQIIRIPVRSMVTQSTTQIGLLAFLEAEDIVTAVDEADYVYNRKIKQRVTEGSIQEVGGGENLNMEQVLALSPDLLMVSGMPGIVLDRYQALLDTGIPVLVNSEWMENSLLAKAEWVKLMAALTNREALAKEKFTDIEQKYDSVAAVASRAKDKPEVIIGSPFQGTWYVPGGNSYRSHLLQQAGAKWPWASDTTAVSLHIDFETMYAYGLEAAYWLHPGQVNSRQELLAKDARFADFRSFRENQVYNNNRRMNEEGLGNDYFESGIVYPHLILSDVVKILHPALLPDYELYYYKKLD